MIKEVKKTLKELDGGINVENSPNEIEDKQFVDIYNMNCSGNKLVNGDNPKEKYSLTGTISGLATIGTDIFAVTDSRLLYKNGNIISTKVVAINNISVSTPPPYYSIDIIDNNGTLGSTYIVSGTPTPNQVLEGLRDNINASSSFAGKYTASTDYILIGGNLVYSLIITKIYQLTNSFSVVFTSGTGAIVNNKQLPATTNQAEIYRYNDYIFVYYYGVNQGFMIDKYGFITSGLKGIFVSGYYGEATNTYTQYRTTGAGFWNGKSFYGDKNNLFYSKTADILNPLNIIDYSGYSAGVQAIGDGGNITGFATSENGLYIFKEDEIFYTNSVEDNGIDFSFVVSKITNNGCINPRTIQTVGQDIFYFDGLNQAVRRLSYEQNLTTLRDSSISKEIENYIKSLPKSQPYATANYKYPNYKLHLRNNINIGYNNITINYNVENKSWFKESGDCLYSDYGYLAINNKILEGGGLVNEAYALSKEFDIDYYGSTNSSNWKRYSGFWLYGNFSNPATIEIYIDGELYDSFTVSGAVREKLYLYGDGNYFQYKLITSGIFSVNEIGFYYKPIKNNYD